MTASTPPHLLYTLLSFLLFPLYSPPYSSLSFPLLSDPSSLLTLYGLTTASSKLLTTLLVIFTSLPPHVFSSIYRMTRQSEVRLIMDSTKNKMKKIECCRTPYKRFSNVQYDSIQEKIYVIE